MTRSAHRIAALLASLTAVPLLLAADEDPRSIQTSPETSPPATTQETKQAARTDLEKNLGEQRTIGPLDLSDVVRVQLLQGRLTATSSIKTDGDEVRVRLKDSDADICTLRVHNNTATPGMQIMQFLRYDFSDPAIVFLHSAVFSHPGQLQLVGHWQFFDGNRQVSVIDQYPSIDDQGNRVPGELNLRVQHINETSGSEEISVHIRALDLATMQREHPSEVNAYVRPVLRAFGAESLLAVDRGIAWQVFAAEARPDAKVMEQVEAILPKLDAASFADRADAAEQLKTLGAPGAIALRHLDKSSLSAEQISQIDEVLSTFGHIADRDAQSLGGQIGFLLDCMVSEDGPLRRLAAQRLQKVAGRPIAFDVDAEPAVRGRQVDVLRKQLLKPPATQARPAAQG